MRCNSSGICLTIHANERLKPKLSLRTSTHVHVVVVQGERALEENAARPDVGDSPADSLLGRVIRPHFVPRELGLTLEGQHPLSGR